MGLKSIRPYFLSEGKAYCAECRRRRLARIIGTRYVCCPYCDGDEVLEDSPVPVEIVGGKLLCGRCGRSEMVRGPNGVGFECALCDVPASEREAAGAPLVTQAALPGLPDPDVGAGLPDAPNRTKRPESLVATCSCCGQTCWHDFEWRTLGWVAVCRGCGYRLSATRTKGVRASQERGSRG